MSLKKKRIDFWTITTGLLLLMFLLFLVYPMGKLLLEAVYTNGKLSPDAFLRFFSKPNYYNTMGNSTRIAVCVMVCSLMLGIPFAYFYTFYKLKGRKLLFILCLLCTMSAPFIGAYAWILLMGNSGLITKMLKSIGIRAVSIYGFGGIVLVQTLKLFPLVVIYMNGAFRDIDNSLLEAAESMGCKGTERFKRVLMALTMPTILAAALLVFMRSFADFGTPVLIGRGYSTFPVLIYNSYLGENGTDYHFAAAVSVIAVMVTAVIFLLQRFASNRFKFTISALHPIEPKECKGLGSILMHIYCYALVAIALLPQIYIVNMSFRNYRNAVLQPGYSLVNYRKALEKMLLRATANTMIISFSAMAVILIVAILIAYLVVRRSSVLTNVIDTISMMPYIMPGSVVGIALVVAFSRKPLVLTGGLAIMVIALSIRRMPFTSRSAAAAMMKIPISMEEAALNLGASNIEAFWKITVPMMSSGIVSGAVLSFVSIITEMSSGVILYNNSTITLTIGTYSCINSGVYGVAAVFATVTMLVTVICLILYLKLTKLEDIRM